MCTLAARHDALVHNPVRSVAPLGGKAKKAPRALTEPQLRQLRAALTYYDRAVAGRVTGGVVIGRVTGGV